MMRNVGPVSLERTETTRNELNVLYVHSTEYSRHVEHQTQKVNPFAHLTE